MNTYRDNQSYAAAATPGSALLAGFHPSLSWRSILGGVFMSLLVFGLMMSLGVALGGVNLYDGATLRSAGTFGGLWIALSVVVALAAASYFTARISNFPAKRIGIAQGWVVASAFFGILAWQGLGVMNWAANTAGTVVGGASRMVGPAASGAADIAQNPTVAPVLQDMVEDSLGAIEFRGEPTVVARGLATRLVRGDTESAKVYLSRHSNLTPAEIDSRITELQARTNSAMTEARQATAQAMQAVGWSIFALFALGMIASGLGGWLGARANNRTPMTAVDAPSRPRTYKTAYAS